jgi:hypothetical protein
LENEEDVKKLCDWAELRDAGSGSDNGNDHDGQGKEEEEEDLSLLPEKEKNRILAKREKDTKR